MLEIISEIKDAFAVSQARIVDELEAVRAMPRERVGVVLREQHHVVVAPA